MKLNNSGHVLTRFKERSRHPVVFLLCAMMIIVTCQSYEPVIEPNEVLVWSDEFDNCPSGRPDEFTWGYEEGYSVRNNEDAFYSKPCQDFEFVHDGHCADGWLWPNSNQPSLQACRDECASRPDAGYFAFAEPTTCACYRRDSNCPDDDNYANHNSYLILSETCSPSEDEIENAHCENGNLIITAKREIPREDIGWAEYTSASIRTDLGKEPKFFGYGRYVMRAKIPIQQGAWPAFWTLGENIRDIGWPRSGEIDIMEFYQGKTLANIMYSNSNGNPVWDSETQLVEEAWADQFHVWEMHWTYDKVILYLDGVETNTFSTSSATVDGIPNPFHQHHFLILNLAIGGINGGDPRGTNFPIEYVIDYVRYYEDQTPCGETLGSCANAIRWAHETGKRSNPGWYGGFEDVTGVPLAEGTASDMQLYFLCTGATNQDCEQTLRLPCTCSSPPCTCPIREKPKGKTCELVDGNSVLTPIDNIAGEGRSVEASAAMCAARCENVDGCIGSTWWNDGGCHLSGLGSSLQTSSSTIASLCDSCHGPTDFICMEEVIWATSNGQDHPEWYNGFATITGIALSGAIFGDMQRYYFCTQTLPGQCTVSMPAPCECSFPPCDVCPEDLETSQPTSQPSTTAPSLQPTISSPTNMPSQPCGLIEDRCMNEVSWANNHGKHSNPEWYPMFFEYTGTHISTSSEEDMWLYLICKDYNPTKCGASQLPCGRQCEPQCEDTIPTPTCRAEINWAANYGIRWHPGWYPNFQQITGQEPHLATFSDMQRYWKCENLNPEPWQCGGLEFPCTCSSPPCNSCTA